MNEITSLIANANDAQLASLAQTFAAWMQSPDCDAVVLAACASICAEIARRTVSRQPAPATVGA
jgi:hypothetical protein